MSRFIHLSLLVITSAFMPFHAVRLECKLDAFLGSPPPACRFACCSVCSACVFELNSQQLYIISHCHIICSALNIALAHSTHPRPPHPPQPSTTPRIMLKCAICFLHETDSFLMVFGWHCHCRFTVSMPCNRDTYIKYKHFGNS